MAKKGENIYKRKDGRWEARYVKQRTATGEIHYGYCYGSSYREAKEKAERAKAALLTNTFLPGAPASRHRFEAVCREWLQISSGRIKESSYIKYRTVIERHILPKLGRYRLSELSSVRVEQCSRELLAEGLSPRTVRYVLSVVRAVLQYAARCDPGEVRAVDVTFPQAEKKEMRVLSREEQYRFTRYLLTDMDPCKFGVLLALLTGMRIGELCALQWGDISLPYGTVRIARTMQRLQKRRTDEAGSTHVLISAPKSDSSVRYIPLTEETADFCRRWYVDDPNAFVLTGRTDYFLEPRTVQYRFAQYSKACGLENAHFHTLRHTFATRCVEAGVEIKSLSEILGHTSPRFTLERYVHSSLELKRDELRKVRDVMTPPEL